MLDLLKEEPQVYEVENGEAFPFDSIAVDHVDFSYGKKKILSQFRARFPKGEITGILGKSGCGKSTLLKLLMRFFEVEQGQICYGETDVNQITTSDLRKHIAYVTQETFSFLIRLATISVWAMSAPRIRKWKKLPVKLLSTIL